VENDIGVVKMIYEQNWLHARHVVTERHWFSNIYVIVVGGILAFLSGTRNPQFLSATFLALFLFSLVGYLISLKLGASG